jgi:hypothetical protein
LYGYRLLWDLHLTHLFSQRRWFFLPHLSFINLMDLSRPAVIGITTPGNSTMFRNGKIRANQAIINHFFLIFWVNNGINSASESYSCSDRLSIVCILWFDILFWVFCH